MTDEPPRRRGMTVKEVAELSGFSVSSIQGWIAAGKIPVFVSPGRRIGDGKRGQKGYRIWSDDWDRFCRANTFIEPTPEDKEAARVKAVSPFAAKADTEGQSRLWGKRRATG